ncbi:peptidase [Prolixibacteraceae bacterium JC049]|nr:peptidase [Prolixibacteraceae bacterium JC049]
MKLKSNKWRKWMRIIHRDLGFLLVGITIVYCVSGYLLNHREDEKDPGYKTTVVSEQLAPNLTAAQLKNIWSEKFEEVQLRRTIQQGEIIHLYLKGGLGAYNTQNGHIKFETYKARPLLIFFNKLHYNRVKNWNWVADFFVFGMLFLAISGLFITPGKKGLAGRGKWYVIGGILIVVIFGLI